MNLRSDLSKSTRKTRTHAFRRFDGYRRAMGNPPITVQLLQDFRESVLRKGFKPTYCALILSAVKTYLRDERLHGRCDLDDATLSQCLRAPRQERRLPVVLSRDELTALWLACEGTETGRSVRCLLILGCRREELHTVKRGEHGWAIWASKTGVERSFPSALVVGAGHLFHAPYKFRKPEWAAIRQAANLPDMKLKTCRSTAATYLYYSGLYPPQVVAGLMGHSFETAMRAYWHPSPILGITGTSMLELYGLDK